MQGGDGMDILEYLKKRQSELEYVGHPMSERDENFKYLYCFGLGVMAVGNMKAITELQSYFDTVLDSIGISQKSRVQIMVDINNYFDFKITEFFKKMIVKDAQYCFMADIYKMYRLSLWSQEYCTGILDNYLKLFRFSKEECTFFEKFNQAAQKGDIEAATAHYRKFRREGYDISYQTLVYFFPGFSIEETYGDIHIEAGKTVILDKPTTINGNIIVDRGGTLLIKGAFVDMRGSIITKGGRVRLNSARIRIEKCDDPYWLNLSDTAVVHIEDSYIDCGNTCGFLSQDGGRLIVTGNEIRRTAIGRAIRFSGVSCLITDNEFASNNNGAVKLCDSAKCTIFHCKFDECTDDYGGAVFSESIGNVKIHQCSFRDCRAKYLGAAIYFKYQKFGQFVKECMCDECVPKDSQIFNVYDDDLELKIR